MSEPAEHRLVILGSMHEFVPLVTKARERGIYTIVCDGYKNTPAKFVADEHFDIPVQDTEAVAAMCRDCHADGIITAYSDVLAENYVKVAQSAGLAAYLTPEQFKPLRNKQLMQNMFDELKIPHPQTRVVRKDHIQEDLYGLDFPVVTKPLTGWGSKGVFLLNTPDELYSCFDRVCGTSKDQTILVQEYDTGLECNMTCWIADGVAHVLVMGDREKSLGEHISAGYLPGLPYVSRIVYPGYVTNFVLGEARKLAEKIARYTGLVNGPLCIQFFWSPERGVRVCECAGRIFGDEHELLEFATSGHFTIEDLLLDYVYDPQKIPERLCGHSPHLPRYAAVLYFHGCEGVIECIEGLPDPSKIPGIEQTLCYYVPGDKIICGAGAKPYAARIYISADTRSQIDSMSKSIFDSVRFVDRAGTSLLKPANITDYTSILEES